MRKLLLIVQCFATICVTAQKNVLFIGNSYIYTNDMPTVIANMASSTGDKINVTSNTPGGCTFQSHCTNRSMTLIRQGGWDVVVLQEQSQYPAFPIGQVMNEVYPYAEQLVDSVYANSQCPEPMFFMTWGRENGDAQNGQIYPPIATYEGMDSLLRERYIYMAKANHASVCPVGKVWHYIRHNFPKINLYSGDANSHPSMAGTYAAACAFYTMIFEKDPTLISYHSSVDTATERIIREVAKLVVFDSLSSWKREMPEATFSYNNNGNSTATFTALTEGADGWEWDFGDGSSDFGETVSHTFPADSTYNVKLIVTKHCLTDSITSEADINNSTHTVLNDAEADNQDENNVSIHDAAGRLIYQGDRSNAPLESLPSGIYFVNRKKIIIKQQ